MSGAVFPRFSATRPARGPAPPEPFLAVLKSAVVVLAVAGCSAGPLGLGGGSTMAGNANAREDLATQTACRQRVSEIYDRQNRAEIYAANSSLNSPFSANFQPGVTSRGLSDQFSYGKLEKECEQSGTGAERNDPAIPATTKAP